MDYKSDLLYVQGALQQTIKGWTPLAYGFQAWELADRASGYLKFHPGFLNALSKLRIAFGYPLTPNSCCRTPSHNDDEDGHPRSLHLTTNPVHPTEGSLAIDFSVHGWTEEKLNRLLAVATDDGWAIGHGYNVKNGFVTGFVHVDLRRLIGMKPISFFY